jgi:chaperone BCS1
MEDLIKQIWDQASQNEFFQGGFLIAILSWVGYKLQSWPLAIWKRIKRLVTYHVYVDEITPMYEAFAAWYHKNYPDKYRNVEYKIIGDANDDKLIRTQYSDINWFWYKRRLLFVSKVRNQIDNANSHYNRFLNSYEISGLFAKKVINNLIEECFDLWMDDKKDKSGILLYYDSQTYAANCKRVYNYKTFDNLFFAGKDDLLADLDRFKNSLEKYENLGISYKRGYYLYGPPGTGKTSIAIAMADYLNAPIYMMNLSMFSNDSEVINYVSDIRDNSIILLEDVDRIIGNDIDTAKIKVGISTLLNCLSGGYAPSNVVFVMTTNHPDKIDPAIVRKGRFDKTMLIGYPSDRDKADYINNFYGTNLSPDSLRGIKCNMVDVEDACLRYNNHNDAIKILRYETNNLQHRPHQSA